LASKAMTKSFNTFMSSDNVMNQIYSLKQFFTDLGCVPKSLQISLNSGINLPLSS